MRGRALAHLDDTRRSEKFRRIAELKAAGLRPRIDILAHGMADEETAFRVEAAVIDVLHRGESLTNRVRGFRALQFGRIQLSELEILYAAKPVTITERVILIRINRLYRSDMNAEELYEATCGVWTCGARREKARYGLAVFQGVVREAYEILAWHRAGTLPYRTRPRKDVAVSGRWEFSGKVSDEVALKYRGGSVEHYFRKGAQLPFTYVNC